MELAKLIWITPEVEKNIMYCARVSNPNNQNSNNTKLLKYCINNKHWSIFETASMCIEINHSRAITRQILRHRTFTFQEFSLRYQESMDEPVISEARRQDVKNRQNSIDDLSQDTKDWFQLAQEANWQYSHSLYKEALNKGIAKECARIFLPEGQTTSRLYMSGTIRSWIHYCIVRCEKSTQKEHREIADACWKIFKEQMPNIAQAVEANIDYLD